MEEESSIENLGEDEEVKDEGMEIEDVEEEGVSVEENEEQVEEVTEEQSLEKSEEQVTEPIIDVIIEDDAEDEKPKGKGKKGKKKTGDKEPKEEKKKPVKETLEDDVEEEKPKDKGKKGKKKTGDKEPKEKKEKAVKETLEEVQDKESKQPKTKKKKKSVAEVETIEPEIQTIKSDIQTIAEERTIESEKSEIIEVSIEEKPKKSKSKKTKKQSKPMETSKEEPSMSIQFEEELKPEKRTKSNKKFSLSNTYSSQDLKFKKKDDSSSSSSDDISFARIKTKAASATKMARSRIEEKAQMEAQKRKGKKKKGKGKEEPDEVDQILDETLEELKGKKGKKGAKAKKLTAEQLEKQRDIEAKAAHKAKEDERLKKQAEAEAALQMEKKEAFEQYLRVEQLSSGKMLREEIRQYNETLEIEESENHAWETYIKCGKLPSGAICQDLTTYIYVWEQEIDLTTVEEFSSRTSDVLEILADIEDAVTKLTSTEENNRNVFWARQLLRECQSKSLDTTVYRLLRFVETKMNPVTLNISDYHFKDKNVTFSVWLRKRMPMPLPNPRRPPKPRIEVDFETLNLKVLCPVSLDDEGIAIRAVYLTYDHYSDLCETFAIPEVSEVFMQDFLLLVQNEWRTKQKYKYDKRIRIPKIIMVEDEKGEMVEKTIEEEEIKIGPDDPIPEVPYRKLDPTPTEYVIGLEDQLYEDTRQDMYRELQENEVNLRKYTILGGIFMVDLLEQPPQPQDFILIDMYITALYLPKELEFRPFFVEYTPPIPPEAGVIRTPEEIEEELKKTEEEMDKLILITLKWPDHVLFLDLPFVCFWDPKRICWTKEDVFDLKHVEESGTLSFRSRRFGTFALGNLRYSHLPFQTWELKPEEDGSATLQITSAVLIFEFNVKANLVSLAQLQNCPNNTLKDIIGQYFKLHYLIKLMKDAGIDIFPTYDTFCYVEGICEKQSQMEMHIYRNMAQMYNSFNFTWSRWNVAQGRRSIVMQMREYTPNKYKQKNFSMVLVTVLKASFIDCTEVSPSFSEEEPEGLKFCADLYQLMKATSNIVTRTVVQNGDKQCIYTLRRLLMATRVHSFSS